MSVIKLAANTDKYINLFVNMRVKIFMRKTLIMIIDIIKKRYSMNL